MNVDSILSSWLLHLTKPDIVEFFRYKMTYKAIWDTFYSNFSNKEDARIYELLIAITQTNQGSKKVHEYANYLVNLWKELDLYRPPTPISLDRDCILRDRVFFSLLVCDTHKNMVIECANLRVKNFYTQVFKFRFKFRTVASRGRIHEEEG